MGWIRATAGVLALVPVALLAGCGEGSSPSGDPESSSVSAADAPPALAPTDVPAGYRVCGVGIGGDGWSPAPVPDGEGGVDEDLRSWVWSDLSRPDPWQGRVAVLTSRAGDARLYAHDGSHATTINGEPGNIGPLNVFQGVTSSGWGHQATWGGRDGRIHEISVKGADEETTRRLAERVEVDASGTLRLPADALGPRTGLLYEIPSTPTSSAPQSMVLYQRAEAEPDVLGDVLQVTVQAAPSVEDGKLRRLHAVAVTSARVGKADADVIADWNSVTGPFTVVWDLPDGWHATVSSLALSREEVIGVAQSVQPLTADGVAALRRDSERCLAEQDLGTSPTFTASP